MDGGFLNALFRDPVINRLTSSQPAAEKPALPETLVAKVTSLKGEAAILRWQGGNFTASLSAAVTPGETLLLKYNGIRQDRSHYRIMARFPAGVDSSAGAARDSAEPFLFGLMPEALNKQGSAPALVRFLPPRKQGEEPLGETNPLLELFVDTENFGLILVRFFYYNDNRLECRFIVESREAGEALELEAGLILAEAGGEASGEKKEPLRWSVGNLHQIAAEALHQGGLNLNRKA